MDAGTCEGDKDTGWDHALKINLQIDDPRIKTKKITEDIWNANKAKVNERSQKVDGINNLP